LDSLGIQGAGDPFGKFGPVRDVHSTFITKAEGNIIRQLNICNNIEITPGAAYTRFGDLRSKSFARLAKQAFSGPCLIQRSQLVIINQFGISKNSGLNRATLPLDPYEEIPAVRISEYK
jgi:hypothetical protein